MFFRFARLRKDTPDVQSLQDRGDAALAAGDPAAAERHYSAALDAAPRHAPPYFAYCHLLIGQRRFDEARRLIERAVAQLPDHPDLHLYLGNLQHQAGDWSVAVASFERVLVLRPGDLSAMSNLANALVAQGQVKRATEVASQALSMSWQLQGARLALARAHELSGAIEEAAEQYRVYLQLDPQAGDVALSLAAILTRQKRHDEARALLAEYDLDANEAAAVHFLVAHALHQDGDLQGAIAAYHTTLALHPGHVESIINLGLALHATGSDEAAAGQLRHAMQLAPDEYLAPHNLGAILMAGGEVDEAIGLFQRAAELAPRQLAVQLSLGAALFNRGRLDEALRCAEIAGEIDAAQGATWNLLGDILYAQKRFEEAARHYQAALAAEPSAAAHVKLAQAWQEMGRPEAALQSLRAGLQREPGHAAAALLLASSLLCSGQLEDAERVLRHMLDSHPEDVSAHTLLGSALAEQGRYDEARASYNRALAIRPEHIDALASRGLLDLLLGDFAAGWEGYRHITQQTGMVSLPDFACPLWQNDADLNGKSLLLYAEQGMGDAIQFVRYVERLVHMGCTIRLAVQPALLPLMTLLPWDVQVASKDEALPVADYHCPLGLLPRAFGTRLETIPATIPYLHAAQERSQAWGERLGRHDAPRVGLVWSGNSMFSGDRDRSVSVALMGHLLAHPRCRFYSLQKDPRLHDVLQLALLPDIVDLGPQLADFAETAAAIANLDLVISVDTSVAHLAGAMGKPVWILLPYSSDFRWLLGRDESPWYPTARLFRQTAPGDWPGVVERLQEALAAAL